MNQMAGFQVSGVDSGAARHREGRLTVSRAPKACQHEAILGQEHATAYRGLASASARPAFVWRA